MTRRTALTALGAVAASTLRGQIHAPAKRSGPQLCVFSKNLAKVEYSELGAIAKELGFDGVDLTVRPGGHVEPNLVNVDLVRAIESVHGAELEVPMITTALTTPFDPTALPIIYIAGKSGVRLFKPGYWHYGSSDILTRVALVKQDVAGLATMGRQCGMALGLHNHSGDNVGEAVWDSQSILSDIDPRWAGFYFDPCHATAEGGLSGWEISLRLALPRIKMVAIKDFYWAKKGAAWEMQMCPLGEGMVNWPKFFSMLARGGFDGPISLHVEYEPKDELAAMARDVEFARKQLRAAYGSMISGS